MSHVTGNSDRVCRDPNVAHTCVLQWCHIKYILFARVYVCWYAFIYESVRVWHGVRVHLCMHVSRYLWIHIHKCIHVRVCV